MTDRHISWTNLRQLIESGVPARFHIPGEPQLDIMIESGGSAVSLIIPHPLVKVVPATRLEAVTTEAVRIEGQEYVRIATRVRPLFQEFYLLLTEIADSIQLDGNTFETAVRTRLESWKELLRSVGILSPEQQVGLWGELWLLRRLIKSRGPQALDSWTGPVAEPHDFRIGQTELEVKTTKSRQRHHVINGLDQLTPSEGLKLFLLSLQVEPAKTTDALSLPQMVVAVRFSLDAETDLPGNFERILRDGCGYYAKDEQNYGTQFRLRSIPMLVPVDEGFPRLTKETLRDVVGMRVEQRISDVRYTVNVDDLGTLDGTPDFLTIIPDDKASIVQP
jgi:hypothetical protein